MCGEFFCGKVKSSARAPFPGREGGRAAGRLWGTLRPRGPQPTGEDGEIASRTVSEAEAERGGSRRGGSLGTAEVWGVFNLHRYGAGSGRTGDHPGTFFSPRASRGKRVGGEGSPAFWTWHDLPQPCKGWGGGSSGEEEGIQQYPGRGEMGWQHLL